MSAQTMTQNAAGSFKRDPSGAIKALFFLILGILLIFVAIKFFKGIGKVTDLIGDFGPTSEAEKLEIIEKPTYQDGISWLDPLKGFSAIASKYPKNGVSTYLGLKKFPFEGLAKAATDIWDAKLPGYIDQTVIYNVISSLPSKAIVSLVAWRFNDLYSAKWNGMSLSAFLSKYLKMSELENLTQLISKKPIL